MTSPSAALVRRALWLAPDPERLAALREAASAPGLDWPSLLERLEPHGILGLLARNLELAEAPIPPVARERMRVRVAALREDAARTRFALERILGALDRQGIRPVLLKGASLLFDVYEDAAVRAQGDIDLLVGPPEVRASVRAAEAAGWRASERALPLWWYRCAHFHVQLAPAVAVLKDLELHWRLHHPSLLVRADAGQLRQRAVPVPRAPAFTLAPEDRLLHLVAHFASHLGPRPAAWPAIASLVASPAPAVRLKWVLDLVALFEGAGARMDATELGRRARDWGIENDLGGLLDHLESEDLLRGRGQELAGALRRELNSIAAPSTHRRSPARARSPAVGGSMKASPALGFRRSTLERLPRWLWPEAAWFAGAGRSRRGPAGLALARCGHLAAATGRLATGVALLGPAFAGRALLRRRRRRQREAALDPERALDLLLAWRRAVQGLETAHGHAVRTDRLPT